MHPVLASGRGVPEAKAPAGPKPRGPGSGKCDTRLYLIVPINKLNSLEPHFVGHRVAGNLCWSLNRSSQ